MLWIKPLTCIIPLSSHSSPGQDEVCEWSPFIEAEASRGQIICSKIANKCGTEVESPAHDTRINTKPCSLCKARSHSLPVGNLNRHYQCHWMVTVMEERQMTVDSVPKYQGVGVTSCGRFTVLPRSPSSRCSTHAFLFRERPSWAISGQIWRSRRLGFLLEMRLWLWKGSHAQPPFRNELY